MNDATTRFLAGDPNYAAAKVRIVQTGDEQWFIEDVENAKLLDGVYPGAFRNKKMATEWAVKRGWMVIP